MDPRLQLPNENASRVQQAEQKGPAIDDDSIIFKHFSLKFSSLERIAGLIKVNKEAIQSTLSEIKAKLLEIASYLDATERLTTEDSHLYFQNTALDLFEINKLIVQIPDLPGFHRNIRRSLQSAIKPIMDLIPDDTCVDISDPEDIETMQALYQDAPASSPSQASSSHTDLELPVRIHTTEQSSAMVPKDNKLVLESTIVGKAETVTAGMLNVSNIPSNTRQSEVAKLLAEQGKLLRQHSILCKTKIDGQFTTVTTGIGNINFADQSQPAISATTTAPRGDESPERARGPGVN